MVSIPELKFDHSMNSLAFKLKPAEKKRQDEIFVILSECINSYKIVLLHLVWADRTKEKVLVEPFMLGESLDTSLRGFVLMGRDIIGSYNNYYNLQFIKSVEIAVTSYKLDDRKLHWYSESIKILMKIPELKILDKPYDQPLNDRSSDLTIWTDPDYNMKPCIICVSSGHCKHSAFLQKHYQEARAKWGYKMAFDQLLKSTLEHHPKYAVIPYFTEDEHNSKKFSSIKRKKWSENYFTLLGEWSQSPLNSGNLTFEVRSTSDRKHWALFKVGFPSRIYAVAEMVEEGDVVMEKVAAGMMSVFTKYNGLYIDIWDTIGEVNLSLLHELYDFYIEKFNKGIKL